MRPADMSADQDEAFRALLQQDLQVARAWLLKEQLGRFWQYRSAGGA